MLLTLLRERNTAFSPVFPFTLHPVGKPRSFLPTGGRIISRFSLFSRANLPSDALRCPCFVFALSFSQSSVLSPQSFLERSPVA